MRVCLFNFVPNVQFEEISIPPPQTVNGNSKRKGVGKELNNIGIYRVVGVQTKKPSMKGGGGGAMDIFWKDTMCYWYCKALSDYVHLPAAMLC